MKISDIKYLSASLGVRYWEDSYINGEPDINGKMPLKNGEYWEILIDVETGIIQNWQNGIVADIHYKICDDGIYSLLDINKNLLAKIDGYVPKCLALKEKDEGYGYGDYVIMDIDEKGKIKHWEKDLLAEILKNNFL